MRLALIGIAAGIPAALALTRVLANQIFGVTPWDPTVPGVVCVVLAAVAFPAAYLPSAGATEANPCDCLRR